MNRNPIWTDERINRLKELWDAGTSAADIAQIFGDVTRNAVIGKIARLRKASGAGPVKKRVKTALPARSRKKDKVVKLPVLKQIDLSPPPADLPEPEPLNLTLVELGHKDCRWPISGEKSSMLFCGHNVIDGSSYCLCHHNRSINLKYRADRSVDQLVKQVA